MDMELEYQRKSNDESIRIFGKTNEDRYHEMLHKFNVRPDNELIEVDRPVTNDEDAIISPLDKLFLIRESAINRNYLDTINKSRYIKFIQEDASVYDIKHDKDIISVYQCVKDVNVKQKDKVLKGQVIAKSGSCDLIKDTTNNLHFELYISGTIADPEEYFDKDINNI